MSFIEAAKFSLFVNVKASLFKQLIAEHSIVVFPPDTALIKKAQRNKQVYMLLDGLVDVYDDMHQKPLRSLNAGSVFGEISVLDSQPATAWVVTKTECKTLILNEQEMWQLCNKSHAFTSNILKLVVERARRVSSQLDKSAQNIKEIEQQARVDALTGLFNRRWLEENLAKIINNFQRKNIPLSYLMIDIDHFKQVNDTYGHDAGDVVLKQIGTILQTFARARDAAVRYGGEEICLILVNIEQEESLGVAERLRLAIEKTEFKYTSGKCLKITTSVGLAVLNKNDAQDSLMKRADNALYKAKDTGRNKVVAG